MAPQFLIAWASVLAVMNSTPSTLPLTMCATALPPPPPTPTTLMTAFGAIFSTNSKCAMSSSSYKCRDSGIGIRDSQKRWSRFRCRPLRRFWF
ncbi:hypothetical protein [Lysobacter gummosus]|uniref:hypothetical protein n=1 Tax=Lysobacter gummosus TaxID=262324 RepID=UPI0036250388